MGTRKTTPAKGKPAAAQQGTRRDTTAVRAEAAGRGRRGARLALVGLALLALFPGRSRAVPQGEVGVEGTWTDNLYLTASSLSDFVTMPFGSLENLFGENLGLRYRLNGFLYGTETDLDAVEQSAGGWYRVRIAGEHDLKAEIAYDGTLHVGGATDLDHHQVTGRTDIRFHPFPKTLLVPGIEVSWRTYPNAGGLDYVEAIAGLLANRSFETRTTLRLNGTLYFRRYLENEPAGSGTLAAAAPSGDTSGSAAVSSAGPAAGVEYGAGSGAAGQGAAFRGNHWNPGGRGQQGPPAGTAVEENLLSSSSGQFLAAARVAQALGQRAGVFLEATYRVNFLDPSRYAEGSIPGTDIPYFDDHYGYQGPGGRLRFSLLLPLQMRLILGGLLEDRQYPGRQALDIEGNPVSPPGTERRDQRYEVSVVWELSRTFDRAFPSELFASAGYTRVWNPSNDAWYDAEENRVFASLSLLW
jgi:hypothetical protein